MKHKLYPTLLVSLFLMMPVFAFAQMGQGPMHDQKMKALDLTEEQQTQLQDQRLDHQKKMVQLRANVKVAEIDYKQALNAGASDKEVNSKLDALTKAKNKMAEERNSHLLAVRKIVGNEKFAEFHKRVGKMHKMGECGNCDHHSGPGHMKGKRPMKPKMQYQQYDDKD